MHDFFFQVLMHAEGGQDKGKRFIGRVRVIAATALQARRSVLQFVADQGKPLVPITATETEAKHIREHWNRMRVLSISPVPVDVLPEEAQKQKVFWWGWDEIPAPGGE